MFGRKKLKRIINNLQISRDGWAEAATVLSKEVNELKRDLLLAEKDYKSDLKRVQDKTEHLMGIEIETLKKEIQRLTRKRDANGRFVKMSRGFEVGDKVRIKKGISSATHLDIEPCFEPNMDKFIGKIQIIERFRNDNINFRGDDFRWDFAPGWLEHVD